MMNKDDALGYGLTALAILVTGFWTYVLASVLISYLLLHDPPCL